MARPKVPLISRRKALEAALRIIDNEGLDALSIRHLADELGVNGASLYHHFANKEAIVVGAAELALGDVRTPTLTDGDWRAWMMRNSEALRRAMLEHPELVPVIVRKGELGLGAEMMNSSAVRLVEEGVPLGAVIPLLEALETIALGSAIHGTRDDESDVPLPLGSVLAQAAKARLLSPDEVYGVVSKAVVEAVELAAERKAAEPWRPKRAASGSSAATQRAAASKQGPNVRKSAAGPSPRTAGTAKSA